MRTSAKRTSLSGLRVTVPSGAICFLVGEYGARETLPRKSNPIATSNE